MEWILAVWLSLESISNIPCSVLARIATLNFRAMLYTVASAYSLVGTVVSLTVSDFRQVALPATNFVLPVLLGIEL